MNRVVIASVVALILVAMLATGVYFYQRYSIILLDPMRAVPADAALIVEVKQPSAALGEFFTSSTDRPFMIGGWLHSSINNFRGLDSILKENGNVEEIWDEQPLVISTHLVKAGRFDFLYLTNLPRGWTEQRLKRYIEENWKLKNEFSRHEYESVNIYESVLNDSIRFSFASDKSVAIFSFSSLLVEQAIRQLRQGSGITQTKPFRRIVPSDEKKGINIYINYQALKEIAISLTGGDENQFFSLASSFARWSGYRFSATPNLLSLQGKTATFDTTDFLSFFRNQKFQNLTVPGIAPLRTALLYNLGFSNFMEYYSHLSANNNFLVSREDRNKILDELNKKYDVSIEKIFTSWVGNEMSLIITEPAGSSTGHSVYACIKAINADEGINHLNLLRETIAKKSGAVPRAEKYRDNTISSIPVSGIIPLLYGKTFSQLSGCYYTSINDYIVFANQSSSLKSFIDEFLDDKTLSGDSLFNMASGSLAKSTHVYLYLSPATSSNLYKPEKLTSFLSLVYQSAGVHSSWAYRNSAIESSLHFDFHPRTLKGPVLLWSVQLDSTIATQPVVLKSDGNQSHIFLQDEKNNLYKLDGSGNIVWKKELPHKIISEIFALELYKDGNKQLLFNTEKQLFLLNADGNNVGNYPIRLPAAATNGCSLTTIGSGYHIYVACANKYIYAYEGNGKPFAEWNYIRTGEIVSKAIQPFSFLSNHFLLISEQDGAVTVTDRKGNTISSFKDQFIQSEKGLPYLFQTDTVGGVEWITTDTSGNMVTFSSSGHFSRVETAEFSTSHEFIFENTGINLPGRMIYLDSISMSSFDMEGNLLWNKKDRRFNTSLSSVGLSGLPAGITIASPGNDVFFLLNTNGEIEKGFPCKGGLRQTAVALKSNVIISGNREGIIFCYKIE